MEKKTIKAAAFWVVAAALFPVIISAQAEFIYDWSWEEEESYDVICLDTSGSGEYVAVGTHDMEGRPNHPGSYVCLFHRSSNQPVFKYKVERPNAWIFDIKCSYNAETIAFVDFNTLYVLDIEGDLLWSKPISRFYYDCLAVSDDGQYIAVANYNNIDILPMPEVFFFEKTSVNELWSYELSQVRMASLDMSGDGSIIAAATYMANSVDPKITAFDSFNFEEEPMWQFDGTGMSANKIYIDVARNGGNIIMEANSNLLFFDTEPPGSGLDKEPIWTNSTSGFPTLGHDVKLTDDGEYVVYASSYASVKGELPEIPMSDRQVFSKDRSLFKGKDEYPGALELWDTAGEGTRLWIYEHELSLPFVDINSDASVIFLSGNISFPFTPFSALFLSRSQVPQWEQPFLGRTSVSCEGRYAALAAGVYFGDYADEYFPLFFFDFLPNDPPVVTITEPENGTVAEGSIMIRGSADDLDGAIHLVQVGFAGLYEEATDTSGDGSWSTWEYEMDVSSVPDGGLVVHAQSVDDDYKHSESDSVAIFVDNQTPAPTYTGVNSPTATPTPNPSITPTPFSGGERDTGLYLDLNGSFFYGGDVLSLTAELINKEESRWINQIVLLDVFRRYYFHPQWTEEIVFTHMFINEDDYYRESILSVPLPYDITSAGPFYFMGVIMDDENFQLLGDIDVTTFFLVGN